jgi:pSer/pThr/pTyr-binding forkhead associated (FHA) protein
VFRVRSTVLTAPGGAVTAGPAGTAAGTRRLELVTGSETGRILQLTPPSVVIGRGAEADLRLPDTGVSRRHVELHVDDEAVTLVDLRSTNGTSVNGRRVERTVLSDGDRISLGGSTLIYRQDA